MPFMFFNKNQNDKPAGSGIGAGMAGQLAFAGYQRKITMIKKTSTMCLDAEATGINWVMGGTGYTPKMVTSDGQNNWMPGLAARHGNGPNHRHAWANIAFFDGHVNLWRRGRSPPTPTATARAAARSSRSPSASLRCSRASWYQLPIANGVSPSCRGLLATPYTGMLFDWSAGNLPMFCPLVPAKGMCMSGAGSSAHRRRSPTQASVIFTVPAGGLLRVYVE